MVQDTAPPVPVSQAQSPDHAAPRTILITGAAGRIGTVLAEAWEHRYRLRLLDKGPYGGRAHGEVCVGDLRNFDVAVDATRGADVVVHLAGIPGESAFAELLADNCLVTHHVLEAARLCGVQRVVLASSNHVTGMYPTGTKVSSTDPVRPDSLYGVSKACCEALARLYSDRHGVQIVAVRLGAFEAAPTTRWHRRNWLAHEDGVDLLTACVEAPALSFQVVYGVSDIEGRLWDIEEARALGYRPSARAAAALASRNLEGPEYACQGGEFADRPLASPAAAGYASLSSVRGGGSPRPRRS